MGIPVNTFPDKISEAFDSLENTLGKQRAFYGISWLVDNDQVRYYAMAAEVFPGEAKQYDYEVMVIEKGNYNAETVYDWMSKTGSIMGIFQKLTESQRPDKNHPCIEWYKSDEEMFCMFKA